MKKEAEGISISKLVKYYSFFLIPVIISFFASIKLAKVLSPILEVSESITSQILMILFIFIIASFLIPYIRKRENIRGVRFSLLGFFLFGIFFIIPSIIKGFEGMILLQFLYIANYILLTFIFCPEVLGMHIRIEEWFKKSKQVLVVFIYLSLVISYCMGFGWIYYQMATDTTMPPSFEGNLQPMNYATFLYYSVITFTTIGYGDITPITLGSRLVVGFEAIFGIIVNVVFIAILFMYVSNVRFLAHKEQQLEKSERSLEKEEKELEKDIKKLQRKHKTVKKKRKLKTTKSKKK